MKDVMKSARARAAVRLALDEDLASAENVRSVPWCDATSLALVDAGAKATGEIYAKGTGSPCGIVIVDMDSIKFKIVHLVTASDISVVMDITAAVHESKMVVILA